MDNFYKIKQQGGISVEKQSNRTAIHMQGQPMRPGHQTAYGQTDVGANYAFHTSVSQGPPPSFLTHTPLGTPPSETAAFRPVSENTVRKQNGAVVRHAFPEQSFPQRASVVVMNEQPLRHPKRTLKVAKRKSRNGIVHSWVNEEVRLSMSKVSIMSMVLGLLFLGILFFIIGFLAAVATLKTEEQARSQSAWQASNTPAQGDQDSGSGRLGNIAGRVAGTAVGGAMQKQLQPLQKAIGATSHIVPAPLQPFARYGIGSARAQVRYAGREVNPFAQRGAQLQAQQQYMNGQQQPMGMQQPYGQPYPSQAAYSTQGNYQQAMPMAQGGQVNYNTGTYNQGNSFSQPMMMQQQAPQSMQQPMQQPIQQPMQQQYYQPTMQQQQVPQMPVSSQPINSPQQQMYPQQPMMQAPAYPQPMMQQPGYYR